jgi:hypothetical protein
MGVLPVDDLGIGKKISAGFPGFALDTHPKAVDKKFLTRSG